MDSSATAIPAAAAIAPIRSASSPDTSSAPSSAKLTVTSGDRSSVASPRRSELRTRTDAGAAEAMNSATLVSAISRPLPITIRRVAVCAISLIRCEETKTVLPCAASSVSIPRIHRMPSTSSPFTGSSRTTVAGSPSSAAAMPSRCAMPRENLPAGPATERSPTASMTSSTRDRRMPVVWASASRWW